MYRSPVPFLGLPELDPEAAQAILLPVPYEATTSYGKGTAKGPQALLEASAYVEIYDEVRDREPALHPDSPTEISRYWTAPAVEFTDPHEPAMAEIQRRAAEWVKPGQFLLSIGGEHSITGPLIAAHVPHYPELHVLQIDAHCDLRNSYEGSRYSHASAMARVVEQVDNRLTQVGIRSICAEDRQAIRERRLHTFFAHSLQSKPPHQWIQEVIATLGPQVYLTVDVDGLDPAVVPATGTPEPGGLGWWETLELIRALGQQRQIVGADVVELSVTGEQETDRRSAFTVAKLTYQILAAALG
ncbi:agmatinase [Synechococcus sp. Nb3U1]|uniref:agmatinase n=1 Tax=Synechococcus sp. Nb3U1 TaxID=1914529 RepID=UPI001F3E0CE4|nr:agmatinase [Synechococcus sp. Nb3U1]MCF2972019.1 agmatinase [Synechococcus sp. Nb3U1]